MVKTNLKNSDGDATTVYGRLSLPPDSTDIHDLTENRPVWDRASPLSRGGLSDSTYGRNRARLEQFVMDKFSFERTAGAWDYLIVRLPGIFGWNMRKNYLYDLLTENEWRRKINLNSFHQWYPLRRLSGDLERVIREANSARASSTDSSTKNLNPIRIVNLFPEPISTRDIVEKIFDNAKSRDDANELSVLQTMRDTEKPFWDDVRTKYGEMLWKNGNSGYRMSAAESLKEIRTFKTEFEKNGRSLVKKVALS